MESNGNKCFDIPLENAITIAIKYIKKKKTTVKDYKRFIILYRSKQSSICNPGSDVCHSSPIFVVVPV